MLASELGPWQPVDVSVVVDLFSAAPVRWWISGGRALELHAGRRWRDHDDIDVGVTRRDVHALCSVLDGWDLHIAAAGRLTPWGGDALDSVEHHNNLWCRRCDGGPWRLDITIGEGDDRSWIYRRDPSIRVRWADAVLHTRESIPYLAPHLQLLYKSKHPRPKDHRDASEVIGELDHADRRWLADNLPDTHPWHRLLDACATT